MAEVARYHYGPTTIIVYDDAYKGKSKEEIDAIMRQAARIVERNIKVPPEYIKEMERMERKEEENK